MAITTKTLAGDVADLVGGDFVDYAKVYLWIEWNLEDGQAVLDTANNQIRLGSSNITINSDGTWSRSDLITFDSADVQPTGLLYRVHWQYPDDHVPGGRATGDSGWLQLNNADASTVQLTAAMVVDYVPASWMTDAIATLQTYVDAAADSAAAAAASASDAATLTWRGAWSAVTAYDVNDAVQYDGTTYRRKVAGTTATVPSSDTTNWEIVAAAAVVSDASLTAIDANAASAYRVQQDARHTATFAGRVSRAKHAPAFGLYFPEAEGAVADGVTDDSAAFIAAEAAALAAGGTLQAQGEYGIGSTVKIRCHADMTRATLNWLGGIASGTALILGETSGTGDGGPVAGACWGQRVNAPRVIATAKTVTGWAEVAGTIGIHISNSYSLDVNLNEVRNFETGLKIGGQDANGVSYVNIYGGHLYNNKINELDASDYASGGWTTENKHYGTRYSHNSGEGTLVAGTRHIKLAAQDTIYEVTNNMWVGCSLETPNVVELAVEIESKGATALVEAKSNRWIQTRLEAGGGSPHIQMGGSDNFFDGGLNLRFTVWTYTTGYAAGHNKWQGDGMSYEPAFSTNGGRVTENPDSSDGAVHTQLRSGGMVAGDAPGTAYVWQQTANGARWKRYSDTYARAFVDAVNGRFYVGPGSGAPSAYVGAYGSGSLTLVGAITNIAGILDHDGTQVGFYGATPVSRSAAYTQTYATATRTHAAPTAAVVATTAATLASYGFTQAQADALPVSINALVTDLANTKQVLNQLLDDLQALGLLQ